MAVINDGVFKLIIYIKQYIYSYLVNDHLRRRTAIHIFERRPIPAYVGILSMENIRLWKTNDHERHLWFYIAMYICILIHKKRSKWFFVSITHFWIDLQVTSSVDLKIQMTYYSNRQTFHRPIGNVMEINKRIAILHHFVRQTKYYPHNNIVKYLSL